VIAIPSAPTVTGEGNFSQVSSSSPISFCGAQTVTMAVTSVLNPNWTARYYNAATGGTLLFTADPYNAPYTTPSLSANDTVWVSIDNGFCEGVRAQVELQYQLTSRSTLVRISFVVLVLSLLISMQQALLLTHTPGIQVLL
jgi:hypothetical protein